ncbi:sensor histidine kinase [Billgrantia desiderata]
MNRKRRVSLASRLMLATLAVLVVVLPLAGLGLSQHFRTNATDSFDRQLEALLNVVVAGLAWDDVQQRLIQERDLGDPRFEQVFSGWYWQISDGGERALTSRSLWDQRLPVQDAPEVLRQDLPGPRGMPLRVVERDIHLAPLDTPLHISVSAPRQLLERELERFTQLVVFSLAGLGLLMLVVLALQMRWGLAPLRRMQADLARVENGEAERLDTALPTELARLASAMNGVLAHDRRLMEHARHAAGNLAHALKTPVSVLTTLADAIEEPRRTRIRDELSRIDTAVRHHLARATAAGDVGLAPRVAVAEVLAPILEGLRRLGTRRGVTFDHDLPANLHVRMAPQDLQEVVGNLLDNALRWACGRVSLHSRETSEGLWLCVEDDGPGMNEAQRQAAMGRGARLDEQRSGSGLGLAIVADLVALHGGRLTLDTSPLGGLSARVWLPAQPLAELQAPPA